MHDRRLRRHRLRHGPQPHPAVRPDDVAARRLGGLDPGQPGRGDRGRRRSDRRPGRHRAPAGRGAQRAVRADVDLRLAPAPGRRRRPDGGAWAPTRKTCTPSTSPSGSPTSSRSPPCPTSSTGSEIGDLVEMFESRCHDVVSLHGGRIIKSLGDSVLFVVERRCPAPSRSRRDHPGDRPRPADARRAGRPRLGPGRARLGDVFGPPVNLAAAADRRGPPQPAHHRPGNGRPAARGRFRVPSASRPVRCAASDSSNQSPYAAAERLWIRAPTWSRPVLPSFAERPLTTGRRFLPCRGAVGPGCSCWTRTRAGCGGGIERSVLSRKEFDLLHSLMRRAGDVVTRAELMLRGLEHQLLVVLQDDRRPSRLVAPQARRRSAARRHLIITVRGVGLRFEDLTCCRSDRPSQSLA